MCTCIYCADIYVRKYMQICVYVDMRVYVWVYICIAFSHDRVFAFYNDPDCVFAVLLALLMRKISPWWDNKVLLLLLYIQIQFKNQK